MKIERGQRSPIPETIQKFAESYDLTMRISYRTAVDLPPVYARFDRTDVKDGIILRSVCGNGQTEDEAIEAYRKGISGKPLVVRALTDGSRTAIQVPELLPYEPES